jgi:serine/threonine-protein kinase
MELQEQLQVALGGSYTVQRELTRGGMSRVFLATETALDRAVVIKVISPDLAGGVSASRFAREIRLAASLQQANIVPLLSAGESAGLPYYTMPFVAGLSLRDRLGKVGSLPIPEALSVLRDVARALAYAHERGVVHRDINPDKVLLSGGAAVVTDFGIAKALTAARTEAHDTTITQVGSGRRHAGGTWRPNRPRAIRASTLAPTYTRSGVWGTSCSPGNSRSTAARCTRCSPRISPRQRPR